MGGLGLEIAGIAGDENQIVTPGSQATRQRTADTSRSPEDQRRHNPSRVVSAERKTRFGSQWSTIALNRSQSA